MSDSANRWRTVEELYHAAAGLSSAERAAFLEGACADAEVRRDVQSLLEAQAAGDNLLERPALDYAGGPISQGAMVGVYRVEEKIGAGGMGEVYRATDTRLHRSVALKVLPSVYAGDPEWLGRFQREARVLASLNHPHIAAIYGLENGALVMELVEGPTLAERIGKGPMPLAEALVMAGQIAEALEYAHEKGVIHRDLKPANIKISSEHAVKVLDFGLAKVAISSDDSATLTATRAGAILGTPAYMAPEQAQGKEVDRRADIWAFGVVLFEMLTGRSVFSGASSVEVLAAVVRDDPPWQDLPADTPASTRKLLKRCLDKNPRERLRDIGEARIAIREAASGETGELPSPASARPNRLLAAALIVSCAVSAGALLWASGWFRAKPVPLGAARVQIAFPEGTTPWSSQHEPNVALSADGRMVAFVADSLGTYYLWVQAMDTAIAQRLEDTQGAHFPFWSPDGKAVAFFADGALKRASLDGHTETICPFMGYGGTWNAEGTIVFSAGFPGVLMRVPASGGRPLPLTRLNSGSGEVAHVWPQFLPDGRHFLYLAAGGTVNGAVYVQELGSDRRSLVLQTPWRVSYASGYLLFVQQQKLYAQSFDLGHFGLHGEPAPVVQRLNADLGDRGTLAGMASFGLSENGVLAYRADESPQVLKQFAWYDRAGRSLSTVGDPADYTSPALSPDGRWLAVGVRDQTSRSRDIWLLDLLRGTKVRLTNDPGDDMNPIWSPDGSRIAFTSDRAGHRDLYIKSPFGTAREELLAAAGLNAGKNTEDWSPDGKWIAYNTWPGAQRLELFSLETRKTQPYNLAQSSGARFSPDAKWVAYRSSESGRTEIYVQPFPATGARWQISTAGGEEAAWTGDGRELFYSTGSKPAKIMAVDIAVKNGAIQAGIARALFSVKLDAPLVRCRWVVSRDGTKFLAAVPWEERPAVVSLSVIHNWPALLEKR